MLYLTEAIDEPTITALEKFDGRTFIDVSREGLDLGDEEEVKKQVSWHSRYYTSFFKGLFLWLAECHLAMYLKSFALSCWPLKPS